jgi:small subunit ribosomal protein S15
MARMHTRRKGQSGSRRPSTLRAPEWIDILDILRENELERRVPEDLRNMIARAVTIRRHFEENKKDHVAKRSIQLIESKIHRLSKYYKKTHVLPADFKYTPAEAALLLR